MFLRQFFASKLFERDSKVTPNVFVILRVNFAAVVSVGVAGRTDVVRDTLGTHQTHVLSIPAENTLITHRVVN